jgi:hypothetical protein
MMKDSAQAELKAVAEAAELPGGPETAAAAAAKADNYLFKGVMLEDFQGMDGVVVARGAEVFVLDDKVPGGWCRVWHGNTQKFVPITYLQHCPDQRAVPARSTSSPVTPAAAASSDCFDRVLIPADSDFAAESSPSMAVFTPVSQLLASTSSPPAAPQVTPQVAPPVAPPVLPQVAPQVVPAQAQRDVVIFWDTENTPVGGAKAMNQLFGKGCYVNLVTLHDEIQKRVAALCKCPPESLKLDCKALANPTAMGYDRLNDGVRTNIRQSQWVTLADTGSKRGASDILLFSSFIDMMENFYEKHTAPAAFVLISGDGDFIRLVHWCKHVGIPTVLVTEHCVVNEALLEETRRLGSFVRFSDVIKYDPEALLHRPCLSQPAQQPQQQPQQQAQLPPPQQPQQPQPQPQQKRSFDWAAVGGVVPGFGWATICIDYLNNTCARQHCHRWHPDDQEVVGLRAKWKAGRGRK